MNLMEMSQEERKKLRMMRFQNQTSTPVDPVELIKSMEEAKQKKLERMKKFGTEQVLGDKDKKKERLERFKVEAPAAIGGDADKIAERKARFGTLPAEKMQQKGKLDFTLDEYKVRQKKLFGKKPIKGKKAQNQGRLLKAKQTKQGGFKNKAGGKPVKTLSLKGKRGPKAPRRR